jgi:hypothetical protein
VICPAKVIDCRSRLTFIADALPLLDSLADVFSTDVSLVHPLAVPRAHWPLSLWMLCYRGRFDFLWRMLCRRCCWMLTLVFLGWMLCQCVYVSSIGNHYVGDYSSHRLSLVGFKG